MIWRLLEGDARARLAELEAGSVDCVVTSPPYWGLRDYGHDRQIGIEASPVLYVSALLEVFGELWRVLRADGTAWLNLGDSYAGGSGRWGSYESMAPCKQSTNRGSHRQTIKSVPVDLKEKDLIGIPWRVAFALQAAGWYLRSDIVWAKPNPMPESVTDRPTKSHEYIFLLTKSARYFFNADAIRSPYAREWGDTNIGPNNHSSTGIRAGQVLGRDAMPHGGLAASMPNGKGANVRSVWSIATEAGSFEHYATMPRAIVRRCVLGGSPFGGLVLDPFAGVATTGSVALEEGRSFVGIELNPKYCAMARARLAGVAPLFAREAPLESPALVRLEGLE